MQPGTDGYDRTVVFLVVVFVLVPIVELAVIIQVGQWLGVWETIALLLMVSFLGAWLVKQQGTGALRRVRAELAIGRVPAVALVDGMLILAAGLLFLTPGFVTDVLAVLLLIPPVRLVIRRALGRRFRVVASVQPSGPAGPGGPQPGPPSRPAGPPELDP